MADLELSPKRLEIFKEMIPGLKRVLFVYDPSDPHAAAAARAYRDAARQLGVVLVEKPVRTEAEARATLARLRKAEVDGIVAPSTTSLNIPGVVLEATAQRAIPSDVQRRVLWSSAAGSSATARTVYETGRQAARLVDKIVKGEDPGQIPVEANPKVELAINMKTAKALRLVDSTQCPAARQPAHPVTARLKGGDMETTKRATARILFGMLLVAALGVGAGQEVAALEIGKPAPDFTLPSTTGEKISLSQYRGKLVLVEFYGGAFFPV